MLTSKNEGPDSKYNVFKLLYPYIKAFNHISFLSILHSVPDISIVLPCPYENMFTATVQNIAVIAWLGLNKLMV